MSDTLETRLASLPPLQRGLHDSFADGACAMEMVSYLADEPWSDQPQCVCWVIGKFMRSWNDFLPDEDRDRLLRPLLPIVIGTRSTPVVEQRRATMAADWLIRTNAPAWLRLAGLDAQANILASLPEITDFAQFPSLLPSLTAAREDAAAAAAAAAAAVVDVDAYLDAAVGAAMDAASAAAVGAAVDAAWGAAWGAARVAAVDAAWAAAWGAAAAKAASKSTVEELQISAQNLVRRMSEAA